MKKKDMFIKELKDLLKKYNVSISHEDSQGSFQLRDWNQDNWNWLKDGIIYGDRSSAFTEVVDK